MKRLVVQNIFRNMSRFQINRSDLRRGINESTQRLMRATKLRIGLLLLLMSLPGFSACSLTRGRHLGDVRKNTLTSNRTNHAQEMPCDMEPASQSGVRIERGRPRKIIDAAGRIAGIPRQLIFWNRRIDNHQITQQTEQAAIAYLEEQEVPDVLVRSNEYDPLGEWSRLRTNDDVGAGWRYTVGTFDVMMYTLIPGRLSGQDWYNPFTDTIHLYSDVPAIAIHEAAYAADVHQRQYPGTYAVTQHLPLLGMWYRTTATQDTLDFIEEHGSVADLKEADEILYPLYYGAAAGQVGVFIPVVGHLLLPVGAAVGHVVGRVHSHQLPETPQDDVATSKPTL